MTFGRPTAFRCVFRDLRRRGFIVAAPEEEAEQSQDRTAPEEEAEQSQDRWLLAGLGRECIRSRLECPVGEISPAPLPSHFGSLGTCNRGYW
jgi:hypothetical protein